MFCANKIWALPLLLFMRSISQCLPFNLLDCATDIHFIDFRQIDHSNRLRFIVSVIQIIVSVLLFFSRNYILHF